MKYIVKIFVITYLIFGFSNAFADLKVVYVDMNRILTESKVGVYVEKELTKIHRGNLDKFKKSEEVLKKDEIDLISKRNIMSADEFNQKINTLREKANNYQKQRRTSQDSLNKKYHEARLTLIKKIDPILNTHMTENDILLVIDKKSVLGGNTNLNITDVIIEKLNKELPSLSLK